MFEMGVLLAVGAILAGYVLPRFWIPLVPALAGAGFWIAGYESSWEYTRASATFGGLVCFAGAVIAAVVIVLRRRRSPR